jgi:hypothetical protein
MKLRRIVEIVATVALVELTLLPQTALASEIFEYHTGTRQMGMGGAYVAVVNDETALLSNPAGLGKLRDLMFTVVDPEVSGSFNDSQIALTNLTKAFDTQGLLELLNNNKGLHWHSKAQVFPSFVGPNFGFGVLAKISNDAEVNSAGTNFRLDYTKDVSANLAYCFRFFDGVVKLGLAGRLVNRTEVGKDLDPTSTNLSISSLSSEGVGLAGDGGLIITAPVALLPTIAVTVRDIGNTSYTMREGVFNATVDRPQTTPQSVDAAFALFPILSNHARLTFTGEIHDVTTLSQEKDIMRRVHAGLEVNMADFFFLRGGMNQRYWTAGLELASERFQLQGATYGEEIGTDTAPREDRRFDAKFAIRF